MITTKAAGKNRSPIITRKSPAFSTCRAFNPVRVLLAAAAWACCLLILSGPLRAAGDGNRSPVDLALAPDASWLATANQTSHTVSLVRTADGAVLDEVGVGRRPAAIARTADGGGVLVSCSYGGEVLRLDVKDDALHEVWRTKVGFEPYGIAASPDGKFIYAALFSGGRVAVLNAADGQVVDAIHVGRQPRYLAISPDGRRLVVGVGGERGVAVVDTQTLATTFKRQFGGLNLGHMQITADGAFAYFPWMTYRRNPISAGNIRLGWVLASRIARVRLDASERREAFSLDPPGRAVADPHGLALTPDENRLVVSAAGTHELLVYQVPDLPLIRFGGSDHIDPDLLADRRRFFRIDLGGRPLGLRISPDGALVYVANYFKNCVQVVDLQRREVVRQIPLGSAERVSLARRGEVIFYDAKRSLDQWYSCHSCHYEGGSNVKVFDTFNDDSPYTFKSAPAMFDVTKTPPWTWHGRQTDFRAAMRKSLTSTLLGEQPSEEDVDALVAFFQTLEAPPNPYLKAGGKLTAAAQRGEKLFHGELAACATCHSGPYFTDGKVHDLGLGAANDRYEGFNTPSLRGVYRKTRLLHDGRALSLEDVLRKHHAPQNVAGTGKLNDAQLRDLVEYLKSL